MHNRLTPIVAFGFGMILIGTPALAGNLTVPNIFTGGTPAVADDVNANFTEVETQVNDNDTRITTNDTAITSNTAANNSNTAAIGTNTTDISSNTSAISNFRNAAAGSVTLSGFTTNSTPTTLDSFTVTVPGTGVLLVTVTGEFWIDNDATTTTSVLSAVRFGLCDVLDSSASCGSTYSYWRAEDPDNATTSNVTPAYTITRIVPVTAGTREFFFNAQMSTGPSISLIYDNVATAIFFPGSLTVTNP